MEFAVATLPKRHGPCLAAAESGEVCLSYATWNHRGFEYPSRSLKHCVSARLGAANQPQLRESLEVAMEPYEEESSNGNKWEETQAGVTRWLVAAIVPLVIVAAIAFAYGYHQRSLVQQLQQQAVATNASMNQLQNQVNALTSKLNQASASQNPASTASSSAAGATDTAETSASLTVPALPLPSVSPTPPATPAPAKRPAAKRHTTVDKRYAQLQAQLNEQQKQLKETQDAVAKNREDLEGSIHSTKDELNGAIAKTHDELVALEKKGERSYFEFDLNKSKQFQRFGPVTLSLRRADTKHKNYDLAMIVDDNELNKKKVNLYEPVWIHTENDSQPVQVVVNRIGKDMVHGYVSAPKYKPSELAASSSNVTPASANGPGQGQSANTQTAPPQQ